MEPWVWAVFLKPFVLFAFFVVIAIAVYALRRFIPDSPLKDVLYDKTLRDRHPVMFGALIIGFWLCFIAWLAVTAATP